MATAMVITAVKIPQYFLFRMRMVCSYSENFRVFFVWRADGLRQKSARLNGGFSIKNIFLEVSWIANLVCSIAVEMWWHILQEKRYVGIRTKNGSCPPDLHVCVSDLNSLLRYNCIPFDNAGINCCSLKQFKYCLSIKYYVGIDTLRFWSVSTLHSCQVDMNLC